MLVGLRERVCFLGTFVYDRVKMTLLLIGANKILGICCTPSVG